MFRAVGRQILWYLIQYVILYDSREVEEGSLIGYVGLVRRGEATRGYFVAGASKSVNWPARESNNEASGRNDTHRIQFCISLGLVTKRLGKVAGKRKLRKVRSGRLDVRINLGEIVGKMEKAFEMEDENLIGSRLTLIKAVLGSMSIYHMSIFKGHSGRICPFGTDVVAWRHGVETKIHRLYALEVKKKIDVGGGVVLGVASDRWYWSLDGSGEFTVASVRKVIDDIRLPVVATQTRWIKAVPIKVNVHAWKSDRVVETFVLRVPFCQKIFFVKICRWWNVDFLDMNSFDEWTSWIDNLRMPSKHKRLLQGRVLGRGGLSVTSVFLARILPLRRLSLTT
ncbi:hypothetical protein Tco_0188877 [Tanacetum coccineum]